MTKRITLVQPRHTYAPDPLVEAEGHIYMPTSLLCAAARVLSTGYEVSIYDENLSPSTFDSRIVGINLVGPPYIPRAIEFRDRLRQTFDNEFTLLVGGQVVSGLTDDQLSFLLGDNALNGNRDDFLASALAVSPSELPSPLELSLIPAYDLVPDDQMAKYLSHEFSFFLSQGCRYECTFCAAVRTHIDPLTKKRVVEKEVYRDIAVAKKDLDYLVKRAIALGQQELQIYLSNLDLFQSPILLNQFASAVSDVRAANDDFPIIMRGLSTVHSFVYADKHHSDVINHLVKAGLRRIGFGIDGSTPELWKATKKPNTKNECLNAIVTTRERYHLTPETLMVFGHNDHDNEKSMQLAYTFLKDMQERCRALPRPHVAKSVIPGNDGWYDNSNRDTVDILLSNPSLFQSLDFTALPSTITHPNGEFRAVVKKYFLDVCGLNSSLTQYVIPEEPRMTATELESVRSFNQGRYDI